MKRKTRNKKPAITNQLGLIWILCGIVMLAIAAWLIFLMLTHPSLENVNKRIKALASWNRAPGEMDEIQVRIRNIEGEKHYIGSVKYHYRIGDKTFDGSCLGVTSCTFEKNFLPSLQGILMNIEQFLPPEIVKKVIQIRLWSQSGFSRPIQLRVVKVTTIPSHVPISIYYDPKKPESSVLSGQDIDQHDYVQNPTLRPITWGEYYTTPMAIMILLVVVGCTLLAVGLSTIASNSSAPSHKPNRPQPLDDYRTALPAKGIYLYAQATKPLSFFFHGIALFLFLMALSTYQNYFGASDPEQYSVWGSIWVSLFVLFGLLCLVGAGAKIIVNSNNRTVTHEVSIGCLWFIKIFRRVQSFSDFECVELKGRTPAYDPLDYTFSTCTIILKAKPTKTSQCLYSGTTETMAPFSSKPPNSSIPFPTQIIECVEEAAKICGIPSNILQN